MRIEQLTHRSGSGSHRVHNGYRGERIVGQNPLLCPPRGATRLATRAALPPSSNHPNVTAPARGTERPSKVHRGHPRPRFNNPSDHHRLDRPVGVAAADGLLSSYGPRRVQEGSRFLLTGCHSVRIFRSEALHLSRLAHRTSMTIRWNISGKISDILHSRLRKHPTRGNRTQQWCCE